MTPLESFIAEVKAAEQAATKGPWALDSMGMFIFGPKMEMIASEDAATANILLRGVGGGLPMEANADFIANSRTYVPTLVRLVEMLTEETPHRSWCNVYTSRIESCDCGMQAAIAAALAGSEGEARSEETAE